MRPADGSRWRRLLRLGAWRAADAVRDVDEEIRLHLELRAEALMEEGLDRDTALGEARRRFAHDAATVRALYVTAKERNRLMRWRERWDSVAQDARYAARALMRDRLMSVFVVATLALGVGANLTAFSLVDRLFVRAPAHVQDPDRLVRIFARAEVHNGGASAWLPYATVLGLRDGVRTLAGSGIYRLQEPMVGDRTSARRMRAVHTLGGFFDALGVNALRGRLFTAEEDAAVDGKLTVLSEELWRSHFAADPAVIGRTIMVGNEAHTIVGVTPPGFTGAQPWRVDLWVLGDTRTAGMVNWNFVGRLAAGATVAGATADAAAAHVRAAEQSPRWMRDAEIFAGSLRLDDRAREPLGATMARWLAAVSAMILLITLANIVNLLLVRVLRRRRELAVRVALGSGRGRVIRLLALEGALLATAGGIVSLFVARSLEPVIRRALFADEAGWTFSVFDARVIVLLVLLIAFTSMVVGIGPALQAGGARALASLRVGAQTGESGTRLRSLLTVLQAAFSVVLLAGAGLFLRSIAEVRAVDLGVEPERVLTLRAGNAEMSRLEGEFATRGGAALDDYVAAERAFYRRMRDAVISVPGVRDAAVTVGLPLDGGSASTGVWVPGRDSVPTLPGRGPFVSSVSSRYFETVGTSLVAGRTFTEADREDSEPVVIVGETMARELWPAGDALGSCLRYGDASATCARVVGIVADVRRTGLHGDDSYQLYIPLGQQSMFGGAYLVVRPDPAAPATLATLRAAILTVSPSVHGIEAVPFAEALEGELQPLRLGLVTFGMSAALALLVALLGLYSLMACMVAWRTREIGVRMALGSTEAGITRLIVGTGAGLAALGVMAGVALALIVGRWLEPHLFRTSAADPLVLGGVAITLLGAALLAGWLPARRAVRISPTEALRAE